MLCYHSHLTDKQTGALRVNCLAEDHRLLLAVPASTPGSLAPGTLSITPLLHSLSKKKKKKYPLHPKTWYSCLVFSLPLPAQYSLCPNAIDFHTCSLVCILPSLSHGHRILTEAVWEKLLTGLCASRLPFSNTFSWHMFIPPTINSNSKTSILNSRLSSPCLILNPKYLFYYCNVWIAYPVSPDFSFIQQIFIEKLLCARHWAKGYLSSSNPCPRPTLVQLLSASSENPLALRFIPPISLSNCVCRHFISQLDSKLLARQTYPMSLILQYST